MYKPITLAQMPDLSHITGIIFDFDGVFTTNSVFIDSEGHEYVECSRYDGYGIELVERLGISMIVISSEIVPIVQKRADKLGITTLSPVSDKLAAAQPWAIAKSISLDDICFLGNDVNDIELMKAVGFPFCPSDAHISVHQYATMLSKPGGRGVVRELCDTIYQHKAPCI